MGKLILHHLKDGDENKEIDLLPGDTVLSALKRNGLEIQSSCGGHASCSDCTVKICSGEENLSEIEFAEKNLLGTVYHITKERLSCQLRLVGADNVEIDISKHLE